MAINDGMGKAIWRGIRYLTNDKWDDADFAFWSGQEWWEYWNKSGKRKYSYRWICQWIKKHPNGDVWTELIQADPYLKKLCEIKKVTMYDQLLYYGAEKYLWTKYY